MSIDPPITGVVIAGGGLTGWSAAAALKRRIASLDVHILSSPPAPDTVVDRVISTLPSIMEFHADIGLTDADTIVRAQSGLRAGTKFDGWADNVPAYVHAYGNYGQAIDGTPFHQQWLRARRTGQVDAFDRFAPAAELGRSGRVAASNADAAPISPEIGYGLHLTLDRYLQLMRAYALHLGVVERPAEISGVELRSDEFVEQLILNDGTVVRADLFVDCTGPAARIRSRLAGEFINWGQWLPCDRLVFATVAPDPSLQLLDLVNASPWGWQWRASSLAAASIGAAYSSSVSAPDEVIGELPPESRSTASEIAIAQGRWARPWVGNCVALGDAAVAVEPLEWTNLHLVHSHVDRLVSMMAGRDCAAVELAEYNRQCSAEADRIRDFVCLHYVAARRDGAFWRLAAGIDPPESLHHSLSVFQERGRLPYYEEETFSRDSWLAVLLGQGLEPRRTDPLADIVPADHALRSILSYQRTLRGFVEAQPDYHRAMPSLGQHA